MMEKDQLDSLATVAVGSEKIPPVPHSHYAPSEVYSSSESPPAYSRPGKSTAVQIARIIATTLIAISVIIGSFILAAAWLQARASCTPESIAALQAQAAIQHPQEELFKRLQPEALVQDPIEAKESLQSLSEPATTIKPTPQATKNLKPQKDDEDNSKSDNESGSDSENEDDYDDAEFPPVHIKLPLQLDLDDLADTLMQQARSLVSCVVERRRSDDYADGGEDQVDNNKTNGARGQRLAGERVTILCESGDSRRPENQDQDILTPIIVPLGTVPMPMQSQEQDYHRYHVPNQFPVPHMQRQPFMNPRPNQVEQIIPPQIRTIAQMMGARMGPPVTHQQMEVPVELRQLPIEIIRGMRPPMAQQQQPMYSQEQPTQAYNQEHQAAQGMMPPPPPPSSPAVPENPQHEARIMPQVIIRQQIEQRPSQTQEDSSDKSSFPFPGLPLEIRRIIQQVPVEIKNIIQHITGEIHPSQVPEGARREQVQEFKPFPGGAQPVPLDRLMLPIEVRNLLEQGNMENRHPGSFEGQIEQIKPFSSGEDQEKEDDEEKKSPVPPEVRSFIHQVIEGRAFPVPRFPMPMRSIETMEVPMQASARVMGNPEDEEGKEQPREDVHMPQHPETHVMSQQDGHEEENRPHYVQPRSVRSIPDALAHPRDK